MGMKPKTNQEQAKRLEDHVIRSRRRHLKVMLDFIAPDEPTAVQNIRFNKESISMTLRWPFRLPLLSNSGDYLGTLKARAQFREGLRKRLLGRDLGKHLSNALFKELRAFAVLFTGGHRWTQRVLAQ